MSDVKVIYVPRAVIGEAWPPRVDLLEGQDTYEAAEEAALEYCRKAREELGDEASIGFNIEKRTVLL